MLKRYEQVLVPEMNLGQLAVAAAREVPGGRRFGLNKVQGKPFKEAEIEAKIAGAASALEETS